MKTQTKALIASVIVIALGLSAVSGITYSWFSDSEQAEVNVTTGNIGLDVDLGSIKYNVPGKTTVTIASGIDRTPTPLGGSAQYTLNDVGSEYLLNLNIEGMVDGDSVTIHVNEVKLQNTVKVNYYEIAEITKTSGFITSAEEGYFSVAGLKSVEEKDINQSPMVINSNRDITITFDSNGSAMGMNFVIVLKFAAVQANAPIPGLTSSTITAGASANIGVDGDGQSSVDNVKISFDNSPVGGEVTVKTVSHSEAGATSGFSAYNSSTFLGGVDLEISGSESNLNGTLVKVEFTVDVKLVSNPIIYHGSNIYDIEWDNGDVARHGSWSVTSDKTTIIFYTNEGFSPYYITKPVATVDNAGYDSLLSAMAGAPADSKIVMHCDSRGDGIGIFKNGDVFRLGTKDGAVVNNGLTIDLNGYTYTVDGELVGSGGNSPTISQAAHFEEGYTLTMMNGTFNAVEKDGLKMLVQNYCDLTLKNMVLDGTNNQGTYTLSNNNGSVIIDDTKIIAPEGEYAFDVYGNFQSYVGPSVTVKGNSVIEGKIQVDVDSQPVETEGKKQNLTIEPDVNWSSLEINEVLENGNQNYVFIKIKTSLEGKTITYKGEECLAINTVKGICDFRDRVNSENALFVNINVVLLNDVDLDGTGNWTPIGKDTDTNYPARFAGMFDGLGNRILNLKIDDGDEVSTSTPAGLFGCLSGSVKNLAIENAYVKHYVKHDNTSHLTDRGTAILAGSWYRMTESQTISNVTVSGYVEGLKDVAGIVGYCHYDNIIQNCVAHDITIVAKCKLQHGTMDDGDKVGGIAGFIQDVVIEGCTVKDAEIQGYRDLGGIVGCNNNEMKNNELVAHGVVKTCTIENVTITIDKTNDPNDNGDVQSKYNAKSIVGRGIVEVECTGQATIIFGETGTA